VRRTFIALIFGMLIALVALYAVGCGGPKLRKVNVSEGDYYSEDEWASLSSRQKDAYCRTLTTEMDATQAEFEAKTTELQDTKDLIASTRQQVVPVERQVHELEAEIRDLNSQIDEVKALPTTYTVKPGDWLTTIARNEKIYNDMDKWWKIFEANKDKIDDPYYIFPDTVLVIPRDWPVE
jgi:nucleoid-associated protein YgaU